MCNWFPYLHVAKFYEGHEFVVMHGGEYPLPYFYELMRILGYCASTTVPSILR